MNVSELTPKVLSKASRTLLRSPLSRSVLRWARRGQPVYRCPICLYRGPFVAHHGEGRARPNALCPGCGAAERHRLQRLVLERLMEERDVSRQSILHVAPEPFFRRLFRARFGRYTDLDLDGRHAEHQADLCYLPFADATFDFVFASHVLEHVADERAAIAQIARVLRPGGVAVLPVPILGPRTVEYGAPNPHEAGHVRAPGLDYHQRLAQHFARVDVLDSSRFPDEHQLFIHEDRSSWPETMPLRPTMTGTRHADFVPVCTR